MPPPSAGPRDEATNLTYIALISHSRRGNPLGAGALEALEERDVRAAICVNASELDVAVSEAIRRRALPVGESTTRLAHALNERDVDSSVAYSVHFENVSSTQ